jgi:hypothetical protein
MKKEILVACICACLILVTPFTVVARENTLSNNLTDEPDIEGLVAQLRVVIDEILQKYGYIPMIRTLCNYIHNTMNLIGKIILCAILWAIFIPIFIISELIYITMGWVHGFIPWLLDYVQLLLILMIGLECNFFGPLWNITETNDITNLAKDCPCLQE